MGSFDTRPNCRRTLSRVADYAAVGSTLALYGCKHHSYQVDIAELEAPDFESRCAAEAIAWVANNQEKLSRPPQPDPLHSLPHDLLAERGERDEQRASVSDGPVRTSALSPTRRRSADTTTADTGPSNLHCVTVLYSIRFWSGYRGLCSIVILRLVGWVSHKAGWLSSWRWPHRGACGDSLGANKTRSGRGGRRVGDPDQGANDQGSGGRYHEGGLPRRERRV